MARGGGRYDKKRQNRREREKEGKRVRARARVRERQRAHADERDRESARFRSRGNLHTILHLELRTSPPACGAKASREWMSASTA